MLALAPEIPKLVPDLYALPPYEGDRKLRAELQREIERIDLALSAQADAELSRICLDLSPEHRRQDQALSDMLFAHKIMIQRKIDRLDGGDPLKNFPGIEDGR